MSDDDRITRLVDSFSTMSDDEIVRVVTELHDLERAEVFALIERRAARHDPQAERQAAWAEAFRSLAAIDLVTVMRRGDVALREAHGVSPHAIQLYTAIQHMVREAPDDAVDMLFFAAVERITQEWGSRAPDELRDLVAEFDRQAGAGGAADAGAPERARARFRHL